MSADTQLSTRKGPPGRGVAAPGALPCLNSNNSIEAGLNALSTSHRKTAFALRENVARLARKHGLERLGFFTLTFADHVTSPKEAGRRFNSLSSNVLARRYVETITVLERMKSGRIHFHALVVLADDVRTGFDFALAAEGVYTSANFALRREWAFWRATAPKFGFGRTELLPVKSSAEAISKYVGKYIAKHIEQRHAQDKGVRLVRYSKRASSCSTRFQFASPRSALWRHQVELFARRHRCKSLEDLRAMFGDRWAHAQRLAIMQEEPTRPELWDLWEADRVVASGRVARLLGITQPEAYASLYQRGLFGKRVGIGVEVPFVEWSPVVRQIEGVRVEPVDVVTLWN